MDILCRQLQPVIFALLLLPLLTSCATLMPMYDLPPIIAQDEIVRPHTNLGRIQVVREVYGVVDYQLPPDIREWGLNAIRAEAARMGADAVTQPEVSGHSVSHLLIPTTEYRASGVAIKFK